MKRLSKFSVHKVDTSNKPYKVVPKRKRLAIYKKLLAKKQTHDDGGGLCILLAEEAGYNFFYAPDSDYLFPEFGVFIENYQPIKYKNLWITDSDIINTPWRIKVLKECIKLCNTNIM